jgi:hypothetical protein
VEVLGAEGYVLRAEHWNQTEALSAWVNYCNESEDLQARMNGWINLAPEALVAGREERARRFALDGVSDVLYEPTPLDTDFNTAYGALEYQVQACARDDEEDEAESDETEAIEGNESNDTVSAPLCSPQALKE